MEFLYWILACLYIHQIAASKAGITQCSSGSYPSSISGSGTASSSGTSYLMQDENYQLQCCGVVKQLVFVGSPGSITLQIWRQDGDTSFKLVSFSKSTYTLGSSPYSVVDTAKVSFQEGDLFGWNGGSVQQTADGSKYLNWYSSGVSVTNVGDSHDWYNEATDSGQEYLLQVVTAASTPPYFGNLPTTLQYADTEMIVGGVTLLNLTYSDLDPDDVSDLTVTLSPSWNDMFELTSDNLVKTKQGLTPGSYKPEFLIEEGHCGVSATATLTVTVTDSVPSIDNLPASIILHEDDLDERLLYTVTMSDPMNQGMWCKGDWTIGKPVDGSTPFIVKMISTTGGNSQAGIYLIEDPQLDYGTASTYNLTIQCEDTYGHQVTGNYFVSIIENQKPLFYNLGNMVEVDATAHGIGHTAFIISSTDADNDQITYTYTCNPAGTCPLALYDSGDVMVTDNLLSWTANLYTLTVTAHDHRASSVDNRDLKVYIANINNAPTFSNVNGNSITVEENSATGLSLYQMSASDADTSDSLLYYMAIDDEQGYDLFEMSSSGLLSTHSTHVINYELLSTTTFTLSVYVNDGKVQYTETFTVTVTDVNEAPRFKAPEYMVTQDEGGPAAFTDDPSIGVIDVDAGDTLTYTRDCGTYDSYITIDSSDATLDFAVEYDLDDLTLALPTFINCTVYVHDSGMLNDSTFLYINVEYIDDNDPIFNPSTYTIDVNSDTPMGWPVLPLTVTDADIGENTELVFSVSQGSLGGTYFFVGSNGVLYANQLLTPLKTAGSKTITVTVTDSNGDTDTATINMNFIDMTFIQTITTDRNWIFIEDPTNITWLTTSIITMVTCLGIIICILIVYCMKRETPCIDFNKILKIFKSEPKRKLDKKRRPMPYGRQEMPLYRHIHSNEVLRHSPEMIASPLPVIPDSLRPGSATSGRATITEVRIQEEEPNWMDGYASPEIVAGPTRSVTRPRSQEWEYVNPNRGTARSVSTMSAEELYGPTLTPEEPRSLSKMRRKSSQRTTAAIHVPVSPSPIPIDNADDDDFRSERLSIASPLSRLSRNPSPTF
ncbi:Protocadherin Fat 4 [Mactra antiquata]